MVLRSLADLTRWPPGGAAARACVYFAAPPCARGGSADAKAGGDLGFSCALQAAAAWLYDTVLLADIALFMQSMSWRRGETARVA